MDEVLKIALVAATVPVVPAVPDVIVPRVVVPEVILPRPGAA
jgi:hypothetical protein